MTKNSTEKLFYAAGYSAKLWLGIILIGVIAYSIYHNNKYDCKEKK